MLPLLFLAILSVVSLSSAGPACTRKYYKTVQCVEKCQSRWGFPGKMMGSNPWGQVMQTVNDDSKAAWNAVISEACGMSSASSTSSKGKKVSDDDDTEVTGSLADDDDIEEISVDDDEEAATSTLKTSAAPSSFRTAAFATQSSSTSTRSSSSVAPKKTTAAPKEDPAPPKTTAKKTTQAPAPDPTPDTNSNQGGDIGEYLKAHNDARKQHGASALTWSDKLASAAQKWANNCKFVHSGGAVGPFGENLAAGAGTGDSSFSISRAVGKWVEEVKDYNPNAPVASHFTQVVWKDTKQVGCALALCNGIFDANLGKASFYVCEYDPPGNFNNDFARNVQV